MKTILDVEYYNNQKLDIYLPDNENCDVLIYLHGGGITSGDKADYNCKDFAKSLTDAGIGFVSVNYSLYPNTKFPQFIKEAAQSVKYVLDNISKKIYISGQSAGAYIISMLCFDTHYLKDIGVDPLCVKGWISDAGQMTTHFNLLDLEDHICPWLQRIDERAPIYFVTPDTKFTRYLSIYYSQDMPNRKEQNQLMFNAIKVFNPDADITSIMLEGQHCKGSTKKDPDGEYPYIKLVKEFILK